MSGPVMFKSALSIGAALAITACGGGGSGGGGGGLGSTPTPTPGPTPAAVPVVILASPATQEFASLTSSGSSDQLRVRYNAVTEVYEVQVAVNGWQGLRPSSHYSSSPNHFFAFGPAAPSQSGFFQVSATAADPAPNTYLYSSMAAWGTGTGAYWNPMNVTAFGVPTAPGAVPVTGAATYQGSILGVSNVMENDLLAGTQVAATVTGNVTLAFNFGAGTLAGSMSPTLNLLSSPVSLGTLMFDQTVYSTGSATYSGRFATTVSGPNAFNGQFTGPNAQETIGRWAFPFIHPNDASTRSATGAWIAKQ